jgi:hypothetical protein
MMTSFRGDFVGKIVANTALASTVGVHDPKVVTKCVFSNQLPLLWRKPSLGGIDEYRPADRKGEINA